MTTATALARTRPTARPRNQNARPPPWRTGCRPTPPRLRPKTLEISPPAHPAAALEPCRTARAEARRPTRTASAHPGETPAWTGSRRWRLSRGARALSRAVMHPGLHVPRALEEPVHQYL